MPYPVLTHPVTHIALLNTLPGVYSVPAYLLGKQGELTLQQALSRQPGIHEVWSPQHRPAGGGVAGEGWGGGEV